MVDLLGELQNAADAARQKYQDAAGALRAETEAAVQEGANPIALYGLGIFQDTQADTAATDNAAYSRRSMRLLALRYGVDVTRAELDDALRRLQTERDERRSAQLQEDARNRDKATREYEKAAIYIQRTVRTATVVIALATIVQVWAALRQKQPQVVMPASPIPIVNIAAPSPMPAPIVNVTIPLPPAQSRKSP